MSAAVTVLISTGVACVPQEWGEELGNEEIVPAVVAYVLLLQSLPPPKRFARGQADIFSGAADDSWTKPSLFS